MSDPATPPAAVTAVDAAGPESASTTGDVASAAARPWYYRIGPGLITTCVVIGPGSIMTSSSVGANHGYSMLWIVVASMLFMLVFMAMGAKLGVISPVSPGDLIRRKAGKPLAKLIGLAVFFVAAAFQSGNSIGVASALEAFIDSQVVVAALVVVFNLVMLAFLFAATNLYRLLERLMMAFVAVMLVCFAINLLSLRPDPLAMAQGLIPAADTFGIEVLGLIGTTFVVTAAYYQAYLVQQKGWQAADMRSGMIDSRISTVLMAVITIMLMSTAAAGLYTGNPITLSNPVAVADALEPTFGTLGKVVFCCGLFAAAYSSFLINCMIGGFILSDGFQLGIRPSDRWPRIFTMIAMLIGMFVALATMVMDFDRTPTIVAAQAVTVVVAPLVAAVLIWLASSKDVMGAAASGPLMKVLAVAGLALLIAMAANTALVQLPAKIKQYTNPPAEAAIPDTATGATAATTPTAT